MNPTIELPELTQDWGNRLLEGTNKNLCAAGRCRPTPPPETPGHSWASLGQSLVGSQLHSPGSWCAQGFILPSKSFSPVLHKFWQLYGVVNGNLLQEG